MSQNIVQMIDVSELSRRSFIGKSLKFGAGMFGVVAGSGALVTLLSSCGGGSGANFTVTSQSDTTGHSHQITVRGADLDSPPSQKELTSTSDVDHTHAITLQKADFEAIASGQTVSKTSTNTGSPPHVHLFAIRKP